MILSSPHLILLGFFVPIISAGYDFAEWDPILNLTTDELLRSSWAERLGINLPPSFFPQQHMAQTCGKPPKFPEGIALSQVDFLNWAEVLRTPAMWTAVAKSANDVVTLANWAYQYNYTLRAKGFMHSWAPITITETTESCSKTILVDTTKHLTRMSLSRTNQSGVAALVTTQTGTTWEILLNYLEANGYGVFAFPAVGAMSIGGTLAVGAHGTGLPVDSSRLAKGFKSGSISNLIMSLDAVVWDPSENAYVLKTFDRTKDDDARVFLVHLGRAFITQVTMTVGQNYNLRCQSITDIKADVLFGRFGDHQKALANYVKKYDRVEAQFFPYTDKTWLKLWTNEPVRSVTSQTINKPYPYNHGNAVFRPVDRLIALLAAGFTRLTPVISRMTYELGVSGVQLTRTGDVWGASKNSLLYYHTLAHKFISLGYTVLTTRPNIQKIVNKCHTFFSSLTDDLSRIGKYPMNQPVEFRITGLDKTEAVTFTNSTDIYEIPPPSISFLSEVEDHPEYDVAVFLGLHYFPRTPNAATFMRDWESFLFSNFNGQYATARVEWAKTWGFDTAAPWVNDTVYRSILPNTFGSEWNYAVQKLREYDPHNIYSNDFLDKVFQPI